MERRRFITAAGVGAVAALAGCTVEDNNGSGGDDGSENGGTDDGSDGGDNNETEPDDGGTTQTDESDELTVATYGAFVDAPSTSPGDWLKEEFESEFDAEITYQTPDAGVNYYVEREMQGADVDADVYLGLNTDELVDVDDQLDAPLFESGLDLAGQENVRQGLDFDPEGRAIPFNTGYISLVYDGTATEAPETFEGLLEDQHSGDLIAQDPAQSTTGQAFLYHTVHHFGEDGYLDFWSDLQDNDVRVLGSWGDAYAAWGEGEAPMVVSYSTDQVFAAQEGANLEEHQIRFLNDQAYANPEGVGVFTDAANPNLSRDFIKFLLRPGIQGEIAQRNVVFPATENAELPADYAELAKEPPEPVTFTYEELQGSHSEWVQAWEREFVGN
jgi:thiamine transport system substrate-binding protein